ncbi:hypothetical protein [Nonomuraea typhae]|uniref:hypothetical protein n=1 Tax=Nonomuraea typhae TaxID=2603600 RepID=UPI0012F99060|nr:hypothetical protein [Nonomuraea typhae]
MSRTLRVLAATLLAAGGLAVGSGLPRSASAAPPTDCQFRFGQNSFSALCWATSPAYEYRTWVDCITGVRRYGAWTRSDSGWWSDALCGPPWIDRMNYGLEHRPLI